MHGKVRYRATPVIALGSARATPTSEPTSDRGTGKTGIRLSDELEL